MSFFRGVAALGGLLAASLALAACGGSSSGSNTTGTSTGSNTAVATTTSNVCPNGQVRFGVEPYDAGAKFEAAYNSLTSALAANLHCPVHLFVTQNYTAEVEAMRAGKLDVAEFGPLGYVFAHSMADAQPVAAFGLTNGKPVTYTAALWVPKSSPIHTVGGLKGHTIAFADPASASGNLYPRYAIIHAGLNPDKDVKIEFAGSHPASMLALVNGKVDAAEVNSQQQATGEAAHQFDPSKFRRIWESRPIVNDPITVYGQLPAAFQAALKSALLDLTPSQLKLVDTELGVNSGPMITASDSFYNPIRAVATSEHLSFSSINS
ncbi:MAG TPA: phosphate/phosphite/phosphonate ABC transporter substrate-binding protein [Gaiellales bacterium]|jgi:phosphonate transport system substrate-binding protein